MYELAKQLGVPSKDVLAKLAELGEFVRSASSTLKPPVVEKVKQAYRVPSDADSPEQHGERANGPRPPSGQTPRPEVGIGKVAAEGEQGGAPEPPEFLPEYELEDRFLILKNPIRRGGQSEVRKAIDRHDGSHVAIKFLKSDTDEMVEKFFNLEMKSLARLHHENIIKLLAHGSERSTGRLFVALEWIDDSLDKRLETGSTYSWREVLPNLALPLCKALAHAHTKRIEHRDIKPANILLRDDGTPVLADFGIAKMWDAAPTEMTVASFRSGIYAPPALEGEPGYTRDVWSIGVVILRAMQKEPIVTREDLYASLEAAPVPPNARRWLAGCISPDAEVRPANGLVLLNELSRLIEEEDERQQAARHTVWLGLSSAARKGLEGHQPPGEPPWSAELIAQEDLAGQVWAEFGLDPETKERDRSRIDVVGERFKFRIANPAEGDRFTVIHAGMLEMEDLERRRSRSMALSRTITWACVKPSDLEAARLGAELLVEKLDGFYEDKARNVDDSMDFQQGDELFDVWSRLMDAREELERGGAQPLQFRLEAAKEREVVAEVLDLPQQDFVGKQMDIQNELGYKKGAAVVVDQNDSVLTLRANKALKDVPQKGRLVPSLGPTEVALRRQRDAISDVRQGLSSSPDLRELLIDPSDADEPDPIDVDQWFSELDESKQRAVRAALGSSGPLLVQGPPGTGKTSLITEVVRQELNRAPDQRILIVSQTHVAVDNALERLEAAGVDHMVRLASKDSSIAKSTQHLNLDRQMTEWGASLRESVSRHMAGYAEQRGVKQQHLHAALAIQEMAALLIASERIDESLRKATEARESDLATALDLLGDGDELQERLDRNAERIEELQEIASQHLDGYLTIDLQMTAADARAAVTLLVGEGEEGKRLLDLMEIQSDWLQRITTNEELAGAFMTSRRVVAGTNLGFLGHRSARDLTFDLCILDEASKATATETLVPLARSSRWILVGDTRQLPPMDEAVLNDPAIKENYDLKDEIILETLFQRWADNLPEACIVALEQQYRMIQPIGDMISSAFYDGTLRSPIKEGIKGYDNLGKPVLWLDTSSLGARRFEENRTGGETSHANRTEAKICVNRLRSIDQAVTTGFLEWDSDRPIEVLVIAPYRHQVEELQRRISSHDFKNLRATAMSVDAVQGRESDLALFSVTRSNQSGSIGFLGAAHWRRINVALSRARFGLTIVGDAQFARAVPGGLRQVLDYMSANPDDCEIRKAEL